MSENTANPNKLVTIVVPVYKADLDKFEQIALSRCFGFWGNKFDICFIKPESLDISAIKNQYPLAKVACFNDNYFKNLRGYNCLMFSTEFYEKFLDYKYIFIYQTDGYAFRDELEDWCNKDYDYIGAPWIPREGNDSICNVMFVSARKAVNKLFKREDRSTQYYQVGNGGISLRKTKLFRNITISDRENINRYISNLGKSSMFNEDVYWALAQKKGEVSQLSKPSYKEALGFSFDMNPSVCYKLNDNKLPFCCHSFSKPKFWKFWKHHLGTHIV